MKKILYPLFAVLTSVALVLGGFSFSAQQGRFCAFEVQRAEAAVPLTAPYIFGALLGCFGVSVAGYAAANGQDVETALNNAWDSFQSFASSDVVNDLTSAFSLVTNAVTPIGALGLSSTVMHSISSWLLQSFFVDSSFPSSVTIQSVSIPVSLYEGSENVVVGGKTYALLSSHAISNRSRFPVYVFDPDVPVSAISFSVDYVSASNSSVNLIASYGSNQFFAYGGTATRRDAYNTGVSYTFYSLSPQLASLLSSDFSFSTSVVSSNAVSDVPSSISASISANDAASLASAVSDAISGLNLNVDSAVVENPAWSDVFGDIPATLESIQDAISSGFAGVLEGVQTFFRPVVEFFAPLDIRDSDDIGDLVLSNINKEHTFTTKFPFCLVNDYKLLYDKAISPTGDSSAYPTPGHFVVKLPSVNGLNSKPVTMDMTYIFTDKYMGLTLGQISQLFVAIACLAMFLHWLGDIINVVKSPNYGYVTVEGEAVGRRG